MHRSLSLWVQQRLKLKLKLDVSTFRAGLPYMGSLFFPIMAFDKQMLSDHHLVS